ncbi:MAG: hypothetical protein K9M36_03460 [Candidatus Pacebacteria bacterium]|nr:hypothetical protein [Candidatus Paceibacterota bacterium]
MGLVLLFLGLVANHCTSDADTRADDLAGLSWETQKHDKYQLVQPLEFSPGAIDVWALPLRQGQWYALNTASAGWLIPINIYNGMDPTFIQSIVEIQKIGVIDTVNPRLIDTNRIFTGLRSVQGMRIVCLKPGLRFRPSCGPHDSVTLAVEEY